MLTIAITNDVPDRFRGFLASCMVELAPGVYASPTMTQGVRKRIWGVIEDWHGASGAGSVLMAWRDPSAVGHLSVRAVGVPQKALADLDGVFVGIKPVPKKEMK